jgi:hypothetical protein
MMLIAVNITIKTMFMWVNLIIPSVVRNCARYHSLNFFNLVNIISILSDKYLWTCDYNFFVLY